MESSFSKDFRLLLAKHGINHPKFAHNMRDFDPKHPQVLYSGPVYDQEELIAAVSCLVEGKWSVSGENVHKFEYEFSKYLNQKESVMVNSGSSADLLMVAASKARFGWKDGDSIIVSPCGFPTTISAIILNGLKPIFVDIEWETLNADNNEIENVLKNKHLFEKTIRAIFISPVLGNPPNIDKLLELSSQYDVKLLMDGCDSLGSKWAGGHLAEYATATSCSFFPSHHVSTLQGGMISSNDTELIRIARQMSSWGRACFPANTWINCAEGYKYIQDVKIGDTVVSHTGEHCVVKDVFGKPYTGVLMKIQCHLIGCVQATEDHLFYVERAAKRNWIKAGDLVKSDILLEALPIVNDSPRQFDWTYQTDGTKQIRKHRLKAEPDLMRLIGFWLAKGSNSRSLKGKSGYLSNCYYAYRVSFAFHSNETEYHQDVLNLMKHYFGCTGWLHMSNGEGVSVEFKSRKAYEFFALFGSKAWNKRLPFYMVGWDMDGLLQLIRGFYSSDSNSNWQGKQIGSTSYTLFNQLRRILLRVGVFGSLVTRLPECRSPCFVNERVITAPRPYYSLAIYGSNAERLDDLVLKEGFKSKTNRALGSISKDGFYARYPISTIMRETVTNLPVYNLSVDTNNSYHANNLAVHNCYCVGSANLLSKGTCGCRFSEWLSSIPDMVLDHKYIYETDRAYNLQPIDIQGALGLQQLLKLDFIHNKRYEAAKRIRGIIFNYLWKSNYKFWTVQTLNKSNPSWFGVPIICPSYEYKRKLVSHLENAGIQTRNYFAGNIILHPGYSKYGSISNFPNATESLKRVFFIGCHPMLTEEHFIHIENTFKNFIP